MLPPDLVIGVERGHLYLETKEILSFAQIGQDLMNECGFNRNSYALIKIGVLIIYIVKK